MNNEFESAMLEGAKKTILQLTKEYDAAKKGPFGEFSDIEVSSMGEFKTSAESNVYGYKLTVGKVDFWKEEKDESEY